MTPDAQALLERTLDAQDVVKAWTAAVDRCTDLLVSLLHTDATDREVTRAETRQEAALAQLLAAERAAKVLRDQWNRNRPRGADYGR